MHKRNDLIAKVAVLFSILLISPIFINSYALPIDDSVMLDYSDNLVNFNTNIIEIQFSL